MNELLEMICAELEDIASKGEMSAGDLDTLYKLIVSKEKLLRIEELEGDLGYSEYGYGAGSGRGRGSYRSRMSYSRGRRYSNADEARDSVYEKLQEMANDNSLPMADRTVLKKALGQMK